MKDNFVSVIVPVFNDSKRLQKCLALLEKQTYPSTLYEIIVVDNHSSENIQDIVYQFKQATYEYESKIGSYAARNKGISKAKGDIFAFTDSDCLPQPHWIQAGVEALHKNSSDLIGGNVKFIFSPQRTAAEIYDSISNMQIEENIQTRKVCKTANLFAYRYVFDKVGDFPSSLKSGGDVIWTKRATDYGFKLKFSPEAEVLHPARQLIALIQKQYRVGLGQFDILKEQQQTNVILIKGSLKYILFPPSFENLKNSEKLHEIKDDHPFLYSIWLVSWLCQATMGIGRLNKLMIGLLSKYETL